MSRTFRVAPGFGAPYRPIQSPKDDQATPEGSGIRAPGPKLGTKRRTPEGHGGHLRGWMGNRGTP